MMYGGVVNEGVPPSPSVNNFTHDVESNSSITLKGSQEVLIEGEKEEVCGVLRDGRDWRGGLHNFAH